MRKVFRFLIKTVLALLLISITAFGVLYILYNSPLPKGTLGEDADELACQIFEAINEPAYREARYVEWTFNNTSYTLDKLKQKVICQWDNTNVNLNLINYSKSTVIKDNKELMGNEKQQILKTTVKKYNNDSFWVLAPFKLYDPGVERRLVKSNASQDQLLVSYTSGGSTPGDSYLWEVDKNFIPQSFKMWVNILPIGGLRAKWQNWKPTESNALVATDRSIFNLSLPIHSIKIFGKPDYKIKPIQPLDTLAVLDRFYNSNTLAKDAALIRPHLTEDAINIFAENVFTLMNTNDTIERMTYREILKLRMRDSLAK